MQNRYFPVASRATLLTTSLGMALASHGAVTPINWSGASGVDPTAWADTGNWTGGAAPANDLVTDLAVFELADFTGKQPNAGTRSVAGVQIGSGAATGALTLSGAQVTLGASGIDMKANAAAATISAAVVLGAAQTWANESANALTISAPTSGAFALAKGGSGRIILTGANTRSGTTTLSGGTLQVGSNAANAPIGSGTYDIGAGSTLRIEYATTNTAATNLGSLPWANFSGGGTLNIATNGAFDYISNATALPAGFTGTLQIDGGRVQAAPSTGGLGSTSTIVVKSGGQFGMWEGGTFSQNFTIAGAGYGEGGYEAALRLSNDAATNVTLNGTITLAGDATIGARSTGVATISNPIGQSTASNLTVGTGFLNGTVIFQAVNTYTGNTIVRNGVLSLNGSAPTVLGNLQMIGGDGTYLRTQQANQFAAGSVANFTSASGSWNRFEFFGKDQTFAGINTGTTTVQGGGIFQNSEANGAAGANATLTLNGSGNYVFNGHIRDWGSPNVGTHKVSLVKNGAGTQTLAGSVVTYSGTTSINNGTLELISTSGFKSATTVASGTTLKLGNNGNTGTGTGFTVDLSNGATLVHDGQSASHFWTIGGATTNTGTTTVNQSSIAAGLLDKGLFFDGGLKGSGTVTINATNAGNGVVFRNNNTSFSGTLIVNGIADATVNLGSGIGVGGCTTGLQNADIQLNGTMELLNQGVSWAGSASGAFQMGALSGSGVMVGNYTTGGNTTVTIGKTNNSGSYSGVIANGTGNTVHLVKDGSGTQTLSGTNSYTGNTTVNGGTLSLSGGSSLSDTGNLTLANTAGVQVVFNDSETTGALAGGGVTGGDVNLQDNTLTLAGDANTTFSGVISGTDGALAKTGTGTLTLAGASTYTGATTIDAGRLNLTGALPNSSLTVADGAFVGGEGSAAAMTLGSSVGVDIVTSPATAEVLTANGPLSVTGTTLVDFSGPMPTPAFKVLQFGSNANGFTAANFDLVDPTSYRPGYAFTVNANDVTLTMAKKSLEWTGSQDATWENDMLANFRDTTTLADEKFFTADDVLFGNLPATDPTVTVIGTVAPSSFTFNSTLNYTIEGGAITGPGGLTKEGSGTATLSGPNTFTGAIAVNTGTLVFKAPANAAWTMPTGAKTIASGAVMQIDFTPQTTLHLQTNPGSTAISAGAVLDLYSTAYNVNSYHLLNGGWTATGTGTIRISGGGAVACWTGGNNALAGFTGLLDIQNGQFAVNVDNATTLGGTLDVNVTATGKLDMRSGHFTVDSLDGAAGSEIIKSHNTAVTLTVGNNSGSGAFAGNLSNATGTIGLTKVGTGTQTLSGTNTHTGPTTVNGGTLALTGGAAIADTGAVVLADAAGAQVVLNASEAIGSLAGGGATGGTVNLQANTLTVGNASNTAFAGSLSGSGGLTKVGAGTLTLSGANSYAGNTAVNAGVLSVASAFFGDASTVTVLTGAVLNLNTGTDDTVGTLILGETTVPGGTYNASHPTYGSYFTGSGSLVVEGNAYDSWAATKGLTALNKGSAVDADFDGVSNLLEYYLDGNPLASDHSILPAVTRDATHLILTFKRRDDARADVSAQVVEYGTNLTAWPLSAVLGTAPGTTTDGNGVVVTVAENGSNPDDIMVKIPRTPHGAGGKLFARLKVTE
ncbi:autotransporter-associated beta strand repeat-containing protein [Luteolibacter arcticus]|uniref:Autotransporter-associated beta strand repeat-containing protein n=1 Tax=Luteolibacter arcticus TaxID=1581411 RepID=A0ABT3GSC4_9BACT|nr:autotransporter-associated beta strand repeat-containing protein [Luteolibacter arcticus]MCW1926379.1 autotransporter-associated beta strand repeat-containing protein [Luteolibacter arcticus]